MAEQLPVATAGEGTLTYGGVTVGSPGSEDSLVLLCDVNLESAARGAVLDAPGQGEVLINAAGKIYKVEVAALKPPQGPLRKFVFIGRYARDATPEDPTWEDELPGPPPGNGG
jgi:hypothetical protein